MTVVFIWCFEVTQARKKREKNMFKFSDCGTNPNRPIYFTQVSASPMPIIIPGTLYVSLSGNITYDLPRRLSLEISITKYFFGVPFMIPCINSYIGSCTYDNICARFEQYESSGCPRSLWGYGIQCHCPVAATDFSIKKIPVNVPKIHGFAAPLINGNYALTVSILGENRVELGCLEVKFSMKKRHRGWIFKI
ncbi:ganglioside GM2 activator [Patella vulgata]|uniref:ganglioside GM2 activator n=1 Tax=Patella vulgata TaxID=6465 RepID=UPI0021801F61|nr:ganglioside GM2 activator [Patella vulgata]